jgi:hypothetical protein
MNAYDQGFQNWHYFIGILILLPHKIMITMNEDNDNNNK